jgi:pantoate--beta-alanine ligase
LDTITSIEEMSARARAIRREGRTVALVPTMGALHEGHLSLVRKAAELAGTVVVSVFVNPTQFGPSEDLDRYPRDLARDSALARDAGCDILFAPSIEEVYPPRYATVVHVQRLSERLCGAFRPGHFDGVCTIVAKLLEIVRPSIAVFGQKDGQQAAIIERMVADLNMDVDIVRGPTVREPDGLAMSSRNEYLSDDERRQATVLHQALERGRAMYREGETDAAKVLGEMRDLIESRPAARVQYVAAVDSTTLDDVAELKPKTMLALAVLLGSTRLIDNVLLGDAASGGGATGPREDA